MAYALINKVVLAFRKCVRQYACTSLPAYMCFDVFFACVYLCGWECEAIV